MTTVKVQADELMRRSVECREERHLYACWQITYLRRCLERSAGIDLSICNQFELAEASAELDAAMYQYRAQALKVSH